MEIAPSEDPVSISKEMPLLFLEQTSVVLEQGDFSLSGCFTFTPEQLFTFSVSSPLTLNGANIFLSPNRSTLTFSGLSSEEIPAQSPVISFYHALCASMDCDAFTETETGYIRNIGGKTLSLSWQGSSLLLLTENVKATITPSIH